VTTMRRLRKAAHSGLGQAMIEFAITIPIVLLLFFGLMDFGRAAYTAAVVQWSAQEGARVGTITLDQAAVTAAAQGRMVGLRAEQAVVVFTRTDASTVTVQVSYPFEFVTPMITAIAGSGVTMQGTASMIMQPALMGTSP
jgi:Flp pilus assembly protein TadG